MSVAMPPISICLNGEHSGIFCIYFLSSRVTVLSGYMTVIIVVGVFIAAFSSRVILNCKMQERRRMADPSGRAV